MAKTEWKLINGVNQADDTEFGIHARTNYAGNTDIAYLACGDVIVAELSGKMEFDESLTYNEIMDIADTSLTAADVLLPIIVNGTTHVVGITEMGEALHPTTDAAIDVLSSDDIELDDVDALDGQDLLELVGAIAE